MFERIFKNLTYDHGCWTWTAGISFEGYASTSKNGKRFYVHRVLYELEHGAIPSGLEIDHLCRNRACCNPLHLEAVTRAVNSERGISVEVTVRRKKAQTHCLEGHAFSGANLYVKRNGHRICRACAAARGRKSAARRLETLGNAEGL